MFIQVKHSGLYIALKAPRYGLSCDKPVLLISINNMIKLTIRSFIPDNFGQIVHIDVWKDETFSDIIARTCQATAIQCDEKMYLEMENGEIIKNSAKVGFYSR